MGVGQNQELLVDFVVMFRDTSQEHVVVRTIESIESERSVRFQGFFFRNYFFI